ncbi:hypothetical protein SUNI508_02360 [Seiridium unicorne]|uniref:DUF6594 domain-containing protein n=1 Tax=Seiridium unicorne TaxID=138068 RepID=A0ABR2UIH0_9PEZI
MTEEADFINHRDELVAISTPKSPLRRYFVSYFAYPIRKCLGLFRRIPHPSMQSRSQSDVYLIRDGAVDIFASIAIFIVVTAMFVVPLWILQTLQGAPFDKMGRYCQMGDLDHVSKLLNGTDA